MEENKKDKIYMLWETLDERFNARQWTKIMQIPHQTFLKIQSTIVDQLIHDQKLYNKYFKNFYSNHVKLLNWFMLASDKKSAIQPYVFKTLVNNGIMFYNEKIKEVFEDKFQRVMAPNNSYNSNDIKVMKEEVYRDFFNDLLNRNKLQNADKPLNLKLYGTKAEEKDPKSFDGHDFYIQTFNACNGWKYIFYNYEKHMQGISEKSKWNEKIRQKDAKILFEKKQNCHFRLTDFEQEDQNMQKCKVEKMSQVFANKTGNSIQGIRKLAEKDSVKKIVFVNHQGKPCTYVISRKQKKC